MHTRICAYYIYSHFTSSLLLLLRFLTVSLFIIDYFPGSDWNELKGIKNGWQHWDYKERMGRVSWVGWRKRIITKRRKNLRTTTDQAGQVWDDRVKNGSIMRNYRNCMIQTRRIVQQHPPRRTRKRRRRSIPTGKKKRNTMIGSPFLSIKNSNGWNRNVGSGSARPRNINGKRTVKWSIGPRWPTS